MNAVTRNMLYPLFATAGLTLALSVTQLVYADDAPATSTSEDATLDALLLETLDEDLLEGLNVQKNEQPSPKREETSREPTGGDLSDLDGQLLDQLGQGEDLGQEAADSLAAIGRQMQTAGELIGQRITSDRTQRVQEQIVADLDRLIEQLKSQCKKGQCQGGDGMPKPKPKPGSEGKGGKGENQGANQPARDSTGRLGTAQADSAELARMKQMLKQVWGHLPAKVRDQMQSGTIEEFLPKYQTLIEAYYSRLAEEKE
ncbi:MAG: hypothetical protein JJ992_01255 [Planctomycetes bacterium]|nr:hypothetical protein [Planctomycetota bacterium]